MSTYFSVITKDFDDDLDAIRLLVQTFDRPGENAKARIAAANSATLLLAATFEEFVREMARAYAKAVVATTTSFEGLPQKMANTAWRRTMETLARSQIDNKIHPNVISKAHARFNAVYKFCKGDLTQDIYVELIHNENNMRGKEINSLFTISNLKNVCLEIAEKRPLLDNFGEAEANKTHGRLLETLEEFFERRNGIAHSLNATSSSGPSQILKDIDMFDAIGKSLCETLEALAPKPLTPMEEMA